MKEIVTSTAYAPLQPPFQVISYNGYVALQIGTLIVTTQVENEEYKIETHSHPVVTYFNKFNESRLINAQSRDAHTNIVPIMEGTVWNHVELRDVITICFSDNHSLSWSQYTDVIWQFVKINENRGLFQEPYLNIAARLNDLGVVVNRPAIQQYEIRLYKKTIGDMGTSVLQSDIRDIIPIYLLYSDDRKTLLETLQGQIHHYRISLGHMALNNFIRLHFCTEDTTLKDLIDDLNKNRWFTDLVFPMQ